MLVLSRMVEEGVTITVPPSKEPTDIKIKVIHIKPRQTRLGFDAPKRVEIVRSELPAERRLNNKTG